MENVSWTLQAEEGWKCAGREGGVASGSLTWFYCCCVETSKNSVAEDGKKKTEFFFFSRLQLGNMPLG